MDDLFDNNDNKLGRGIGDGISIERPYNPEPNTLNFDPQPVTRRNVNITMNYECPECGGRFRNWENYGVTSSQSGERCPFCHTTKGEYGDQKINDLQEENEELREEIEELEEKLEQVKEAFE